MERSLEFCWTDSIWDVSAVLKSVVGICLADLYRFSITLLDDVYFIIALFHHSIPNKIYGNQTCCGQTLNIE
jgi:hypothetical protein